MSGCNFAFKLCRVCKEEKDLSSFYKNRTGKDGYAGLCKKCDNQKTRDNRKKNLEEFRAYDRKRTLANAKIVRERVKKWNADPKNKERRVKTLKRWNDRNKIKTTAYLAVRNALLRGELKKSVCEICKATEAQAHHDDYSKPLIVRWLCDIHHKQHHREERERRRNERL